MASGILVEKGSIVERILWNPSRFVVKFGMMIPRDIDLLGVHISSLIKTRIREYCQGQ